MDGNRRWASDHNLPTLKGHQRGYEVLKEMVTWARDAKVKYVIAYAFSTENWNRSEEEVSYLMNLFKEALTMDIASFKKENIRVSIIGERTRLRGDIQEGIKSIEEETKGQDGVHLILAISYGGRSEILNAFNTFLLENSGRGGTMTEEVFEKYLWTRDIPDPDLIIRTGGETRLSNFLSWQSVYSELVFLDTHWPAFSREEFDEALQIFSKRQRRKGR